MQLTSTRKKANEITSNILNRIAVRGQRKVADALGINESQISRWKDSFIPKMGMLLAVLEWSVEDEELEELAKKVARMLTKEKPRRTANSSRPDVERMDQSTGVIMTKQLSPYQDKIHKHILRDRFLSSFKQPGRFRAGLEKVKLMQKEKGHE